MKFLKAVLLASLMFSSFAMGDENVSADCDQSQTSPLSQNPLDGIAPNCLARRIESSTPQEYLRNDQSVCDCIDRYPLATLLNSNVPPARTKPAEINQPFVDVVEEEVVEASEIPPSRANVQCITFIEFNSFREMPTDNDFFSSLPTGAFNLSDWRKEDLIRRYDIAPANERRIIESRLEFLHRNALLSALMDGVPGPTLPNMRQKQEEAFQILKRLAPAAGSSCASTPNQCIEESQRSGAYANYRRELAAFMDNDDFVTKLDTVWNENIMRLVNIDTERIARNEFPLNNAEDLYSYMNITTPELMGECIGPDSPATCYETFPTYCRGLRTTVANISRNQPLPGTSIDNRIMVENNFNGWTGGFERFNNQICNTPHQNSAGQSLTFFQYKAQQCPGGERNSSACSDRTQLLSQYLEAFPAPDDSEASNRAAFGRSLDSDPVIQAAEATLFAGNRTVMAKENALRFSIKESYPTISKDVLLSLKANAQSPSASSGKSSTGTSSSAVLSPGYISPFNPIGQAAAATPSRVRKDYVQDESRTPDVDTFRSSATRDYYRPFDMDTSFYDNAPLRAQPDNRRTLNQGGEINPQQPVIPQQAQVSPVASSRGSVDRTPASVSGGGRVSTGGGSSAAAAAPEAVRGNSSGGRRAIIEVTPRRGSAGRGGRSPASASQVESTPQNFDFRPVIPVEVNESLLTSAITDPQVLANDPGIMDKVNSSTEQVVRLGLRVAGSNEDTVVYAIKEASGVRFSLTPPTAAAQRIAPTLRDNEMNLRVVDQTSYIEIRRNPASLLQNQELLRTARSFNGDVVRIFMYSPEGERTEMFFNKRLNDVTLRN